MGKKILLCLVLFVSMFSNVAWAEEKQEGFWDKAKNKIVNYVSDLWTVEGKPKEGGGVVTLRKCGNWLSEPGCNINNWLYQSTLVMLKSITGLLKVVLVQSDLTNDPTIKGFRDNITSLAWTFLLTFLTFQLVRCICLFILQEDYSDLKPLLRNLVIAAGLVNTVPWICSNLFKLGNLFTLYYLNQMTQLPNQLETLGQLGQALLLLVFLIIMVLLMIIIILQMAIRSAEFAFLSIIGPLAIVTIINKEMNFFLRWWKNLLAIVFAQAIQTMMLVVSLKMIGKPSSGVLLTVVGFLVLTMRVPTMANEWFQSGSGQAGVTGGALKSVGNMAMGAYSGGVSKVAGAVGNGTRSVGMYGGKILRNAGRSVKTFVRGRR